MNRTTWIIIAAVCILGLGGLILFTKKDTTNVDNLDPTAIIASTDDVIGDRVRGNTDAKVIVIEYADFQCPGCYAAHNNIAAIYSIYGPYVTFAFRNFPLTTIHPNAIAAATAAEAAGLQGKYWEMSDTLFDNRDSWASLSSSERGEMFATLAKQIGLDTDQLKDDMANNKQIQTKIATDRALGSKAGVTATPTFFINGTKLDEETVNDLLTDGGGSKFMDILDSKLKEAGVTPPARQ